MIIGTKDAISDVPISADLMAAAGQSAAGLAGVHGIRRAQEAMVAKSAA